MKEKRLNLWLVEFGWRTNPGRREFYVKVRVPYFGFFLDLSLGKDGI